ncbi:hypothetical protein [Agrococcus carbonis]|uniref:hypothetical protein n=1 Tax=Agrococcus carbonis TaxID=684552 RepID=UPI0012FCAF14|nr:hypothetical protein [Agrococcus carbonis]
MSEAVRQAREEDFPAGVDLGSLELQQAVETPSLRGGAARDAVVALILGIALVAPLGGVLAPFGGADVDAFAGTGNLDPAMARTLVVLCFWVAALGQLVGLVAWWRGGRMRSGLGTAAAALAVVCAALAAWWHVDRAEPAQLPALLAPIVLTGLVGLVALVARLTRSTGGDARLARRARIAERMQALPEAEQQALRDERQQILEALRERGLIDDGLAVRASAAPMGEWYLLDARAGSTRDA